MSLATRDAAEILNLSRSRVRRLTHHARPVPLPCGWSSGRREFDDVAIRAWADRREEWWKGEADRREEERRQREAERVSRVRERERLRREKIRSELAVGLGVTTNLLNRWQAKGWL